VPPGRLAGAEVPREGSPLRLNSWPFCILLNSCGAFRFGTELGHDRRTVWRAQSFLCVCVFSKHTYKHSLSCMCEGAAGSQSLFFVCIKQTCGKAAGNSPGLRHAGVNPPVGNQVTLLYGKDAMCPNRLEKCC
jgi:hypothetical protein